MITLTLSRFDAEQLQDALAEYAAELEYQAAQPQADGVRQLMQRDAAYYRQLRKEIHEQTEPASA